MSSAEPLARRGRRAAISIVALALLPTTLYGQSVPSTSRASEPALVQFAAAIRLAELEGAQAPRDSVTGRDARRCVDASGQKQATSGQSTAGSFLFYATVWHQAMASCGGAPRDRVRLTRLCCARRGCRTPASCESIARRFSRARSPTMAIASI